MLFKPVILCHDNKLVMYVMAVVFTKYCEIVFVLVALGMHGQYRGGGEKIDKIL